MDAILRLKHLFILAAALIASLPACSIGYHAVYADHPEENGQCLQLSYMPGAYFNVNLTDKVGWAKAAGTVNPYIKAQLYFYTDEYMTQPASVFADDSGYLVDAVEDKQLRQTVRTNVLTQELRSFDDFYFFIPQQVVDKMSQKYADNKEGKCKIYFKLRLTNRSGVDYIKANKSFKPGSFTLKIGGKSSCGFLKYGCWTEFVGNRIERGLGFDNADAKEGLYNFKVHYYGTNLMKKECGGKYREPYSFRLSFWQDAAMTKPFNMDFSKPAEIYDGYEMGSNTWDDPNNVNPDRRNYIKGTRKNLDPFDIYVREVVLDGFFHQGCGVYDVDTFVTVYFSYEPDIPSLKLSSTSHTVGSFRWWHIVPPKLPGVTSEVVEKKEYGGDDKKTQPNDSIQNDTTENDSVKIIWPIGRKPTPPGYNQNDTTKIIWPIERKPTPPGGEHEHDWVYETKHVTNWVPYQTVLKYGSIGIDLQLVQDAKNDSIVFYVMSAPVSQALYEHEMDDNPSDVKDSSKPVTNVSASDAQFFRDRLNSDVSEDYGIKFRVPKKEEWLLAASQLQDMGNGYDEVLDELSKENVVRDKEGFIISHDVVGFYTGSRDSSGKPTLKVIPKSSSPTTGIRLIADQLVESALPSEVSVATNAKYDTKTNYRRITQTFKVKRCKTCGKIVSNRDSGD